MKVYLGSDHAGFEAKEKVKAFLETAGYSVADLGDLDYNQSDDYPDYAFKVGEAVVAEPGSLGVLLCGSGTGICIAANKVKGVRAAYIESREHAVAARNDDDSNIIVLDDLTFDPVKDFPTLETFLTTPFSNAERHVRRIGKITEYENK
jgi:ribose 5-phosphate isomerase B